MAEVDAACIGIRGGKSGRHNLVRGALGSGHLTEILAIDAGDHLIAIVSGQGDIKRWQRSACRDLGEIESNRARAWLIVPRSIRYGRKDVIPIPRPLALSHDVVHAVWKIQREFHLSTPHGRGKTELRRCAGSPVVLAMTELVGLSIRRSQFEHRRAQANGRPRQCAKLFRLARLHRDSELLLREIAFEWRIPTDEFLGKKRPCRATPERPQQILLACDDMRNGEVPVCVSLHPELVGLAPSLKVVEPLVSLWLLLKADPQARCGRIRIA